jgi:hypothetical protein
LRAASLLLVLFISRRTSPTGVSSSLDQRAARGRANATSRSTTWPRSAPPASAQRSATMRGAAIGSAGALPSSGSRRSFGGGAT